MGSIFVAGMAKSKVHLAIRTPSKKIVVSSVNLRNIYTSVISSFLINKRKLQKNNSNAIFLK